MDTISMLGHPENAHQRGKQFKIQKKEYEMAMRSHIINHHHFAHVTTNHTAIG